jgi:hypothetical protein
VEQSNIRPIVDAPPPAPPTNRPPSAEWKIKKKADVCCNAIAAFHMEPLTPFHPSDVSFIYYFASSLSVTTSHRVGGFIRRFREVQRIYFKCQEDFD